MIEIEPTIGGFIPDAEEVLFNVTLDVEGYDGGMTGHFAESEWEIFVGCCDNDHDCYGVYTLRLYAPDMIDDLSLIHGAPGILTVTMTTPGAPVEQVLDVTLFAMEIGSEWQYCEFVDPLPINGPPVDLGGGDRLHNVVTLAPATSAERGAG
jgi:hypothetical protein